MSIKGNTLKEFDFEKVAKVMNLVDGHILILLVRWSQLMN